MSPPFKKSVCGIISVLSALTIIWFGANIVSSIPSGQKYGVTWLNLFVSKTGPVPSFSIDTGEGKLSVTVSVSDIKASLVKFPTNEGTPCPSVLHLIRFAVILP